MLLFLLLISNALLLAVPGNLGLPINDNCDNYTKSVLHELLSKILPPVEKLNNILKSSEENYHEAAIRPSSANVGLLPENNSFSANILKTIDNSHPFLRINESLKLFEVSCFCDKTVNGLTTDKPKFFQAFCFPDLQIKCILTEIGKNYPFQPEEAMKIEENSSTLSVALTFVIYLGIIITVIVLMGSCFFRLFVLSKAKYGSVAIYF